MSTYNRIGHKPRRFGMVGHLHASSTLNGLQNVKSGNVNKLVSALYRFCGDLTLMNGNCYVGDVAVEGKGAHAVS